MTLRRVAGRWEVSFNLKGFPRLHLSLGPVKALKAADAKAQHDAVHKLYRQNRRDMIAQLTLPKADPQRLTPARLAAMVEHHEPLVPIPAPPPAPAEAQRSPWGTVEEIGARWLDWLETHPKRRRGTFKTRRAQFRRFAAFVYQGTPVGQMEFEAVTSAVVDAYQASLVHAETPANTITAYMIGVGALWRWAQRMETNAAREERRAVRAVYSPIDRDRQHTDTTSRKRYLAPAEGDRLLTATPEPLFAVVALGLLAGLRLDEALTLRRSEVDLALGLLSIEEKPLPDGSVWKPKTRRGVRHVPIGPSLRTALERHLSGAYAGDYWLTPRLTDAAWPWSARMLQLEFTKVVLRAGLPAGRKDPNGVTYHTLRHTFASQLVSNGVDLYTVAKLLGDSLAVVEATYAHLSPDVQALAVAKLARVFTLPALASPVAPDALKKTQPEAQK